MVLNDYFEFFRSNLVGYKECFESPFGKKEFIYLDWTASGRLYRPIENALINNFGTFYANTHSAGAELPKLIAKSYNKAKQIIKEHVNANDNDCMFLVGTGMTSAISKFHRILGLKNSNVMSSKERPVVFVTHMEHHSNQTSWIECNVDLVIIPPSREGTVDLDNFEKLLNLYKDRKFKIGSFTACSNVTGITTPYHKLAKLIHEHNGLCFVDFATCAPYIKIDMHPEDKMEKLDAIFFSGHKFIGGPMTPGVLIFDSELYKCEIPDQPGGGTVFWTNPWGDRVYIPDIEMREDGGTPGILQAIKLALTIELKSKMGIDNILLREKDITQHFLNELSEVPNITIYASNIKNRLPIFSMNFKDTPHYLAVKLLNDRYGIQCRGGCSCAGTYAHYLLNIGTLRSSKIVSDVESGELTTKLGWVRLSFNPLNSDYEIDYTINALKEAARNIIDWKCDYTYDTKSNEFMLSQSKNYDTIINSMFEF